ncbi:MAG: T9SS type A sorting domain-containing protein [Saprospiraceae bacterium]|nr:T9SS type A sorting domain-containing protein [Saprospiraceae bacterium]HNL38560.1 T9SS type A sorting domain-containing protein [Saprospiraceae bacterium]
MKKTLFSLLLTLSALFPLSAQVRLPPGAALSSPVAARGAALVLDSVWESRYMTFPATDSLVSRRDLYTYYGDTLYEKQTLELQYPLPDFSATERVLYKINPATGQVLSETTLKDLGSGEDTSTLRTNHYRPGNPALLDSTLFFRNSQANLLAISNARYNTYNSEDQRIQEGFYIYKLSDGTILLATRTDYTYNQNGLAASSLVYQISLNNPAWQLQYKQNYHYSASLQLDTIFRYDYSPSGYSPSLITTYAYDDQERLSNYRLFSYNNSGGIPLLILEQIYLRDDQGRTVELQEISYTEGSFTGESKTFYTYVEDDYYHLETAVNLDVGVNQYYLEYAREYFYSGAAGAAGPVTAEPLQIYPNPAGPVFYLDLPAGAPIQVYNGSGRLVLRRLCTMDGLQAIDAAGLPTGTYYVRAGNKTGVLVKTQERY